MVVDTCMDRCELFVCRGCNLLQALKLTCPSLSALDATFCTQLDSLTLSRALAGASHLDSLVLSVCMGLDPVIPTDLTSIVNLSLLDLSYTGIQVCAFAPACTVLSPRQCCVHCNTPKKEMTCVADAASSLCF